MKNQYIFTSSFDRQEIIDYGVLETSNGKLLKLEEKPSKAFEVLD